MHSHPSTELALKAFEADVAFSAALAQFQKDAPEDTILAEARRAAGHGFSWFCRPSEPGFFEVRLRHSGGAEISAEGESIRTLLAGLLGHSLAHDVVIVPAQTAAEREQDEAWEAAANALLANLSPSPAQAAAESLAAATGGVVVAEPDESERLAATLTAEQRAVAVEMISSLSAEARKAFTISFRDAFRVPRETKAIAPLITEVRHLEFCDRWSIEAAGGVAP